jgi:GxxExxY protein
MPIKCSLPISPLSDIAFAQIDHEVMGCAYASQNALGRLCEERVYENDLAARLRERGLKEVYTQVPIAVTHGPFSKIYRLDLVVSGMIYELKTVTAWASEHETQAIHYAALLGTDRVKLVNFRPGKVAGKLVRCPVGRRDRTQVELITTRWQPISSTCDALKEETSNLLADWGAYLEAELYEEALVHFHGGESLCTRRVRVIRDGLDLGSQRMLCHAENIGFQVTAMTQEQDDYEQHLLRLLRLTRLEAIQWINLNHAKIQFVTLRSGKRIEPSKQEAQFA